MDLLTLFLPLIILFGLITSYEDIYEGKIRNRYVLLALFVGIVIYASFFIYILLDPTRSINVSFWIQTIINSFIMLIIGFFLWLVNFWSAGDAKLLFAYSFIIPISIYKIDSIPFFQSFYLIFNSFIPFLALAITLTIREKITDIKYGGVREEFGARKLLENGLYTFTITWISSYIIEILNIRNNILSIIITSSLLVYIIRKYIFESIPEKLGKIPLQDISIIITGIMIAALRIFLEHETIWTFNFLWTFAIYYVIISAVKGYIKSETKIFFTKQVHVLHLKRGTCLADTIIKKKDEDKYIISKSNKLKHKLKAEFPSELDDETIKKMVKLYKRNKFEFKKVSIHKTMPFAPLMFVGAIITIIAQGALTNLL